ncbi:hypothetical protein AB1Y20_001146 [Prymnesium parvum]|uniref:Uncharacterized protein n=1 Tax=Prymnesium parvum TaxID=97485 RepID=A0AB34KB48_PRYPA
MTAASSPPFSRCQATNARSTSSAPTASDLAVLPPSIGSATTTAEPPNSVNRTQEMYRNGNAADMASRKRSRSAKQLTARQTPPDPRTPFLTTRAQKEAQLLALAIELDVVLMPIKRLVKQLGHAMLSRMCAREGMNVYQTMDFTLPNFPLSAARRILSAATQMEKGTATWKWMTFPAVAAMFGPLFQECDFICAGSTRALRTDSEPVIRVLATLLPGVQISHTGRGEIDRLHVTAIATPNVWPPAMHPRIPSALLLTRRASMSRLWSISPISASSPERRSRAGSGRARAGLTPHRDP